jgi:RHS repeat-associated protein
VMGASILPLTNIVTVNGQTAYRNQEYFRQQIGVTNVSKPVWTNMTVVGGQTVTGNVYVAEEPEHFNYDADGNLTNDGRWTYVWDGENRLIQMSVNTNVGPQYKLSFVYDYKGRRVQKIVSTNGVIIYANNFLYDRWNLVAILNSSSAILASFMWGSDLSGSTQGAGGVGGLLEVSDYGSSNTNCFPAFVGNGNVMALVNAADGTLAAEYDYGPFGELIRQTGPMATTNPYRFSTKYDDDESDLLYYGYRYYKPSTGTWLSRDPKAERGGKNLYDFVHDDPIMNTDPDGRAPTCGNPATSCCTVEKVELGYLMLRQRWLDATKFLTAHNVPIAANDKKGVSCVESANLILSFMAPVPPCWTCYIQRRAWTDFGFQTDDENSIRCDANSSMSWPSVVFDWWYEKDEDYDVYVPIPEVEYNNTLFPKALPDTQAMKYTAASPAPSDTCTSQFSGWQPENYNFLWIIVDQWGTSN